MKVDIVVKSDEGGTYRVVTYVEGKIHDQTGPFSTFDAAKAAADDLAKMLASVNN